MYVVVEGRIWSVTASGGGPPLVKKIGIKDYGHVGVTTRRGWTRYGGKSNGVLRHRDLLNAMNKGPLFANVRYTRDQVFATKMGARGENITDKKTRYSTRCKLG